MKTVLITGTSSGIGRAAAMHFQKMGWNVSATMRKPEKEKELTKLKNVKCLRLNVNDRESIKTATDATIEFFGQIDVVVNNAGVYAIGPFEASTDNQVKIQFDTNLFGLMNVTREVLPHFRENKNGVFINISSIAGRTVVPLQSLYHGTKWAVEGFSESLQYEVSQFNIKIKLIEPGVIKTGFSNRDGDTLIVMKDNSLSVYDNYAQNIIKNLIKANSEGSDPRGVAKVIYKAATDNKKRLIYPVGKSAYLTLALRKFLPRKWFYKTMESVLAN